MHEIIQKIHIPERPRTGIIEERDLFAKLQEDQRAQRKRMRREKLLAALRFHRRGRRR